MGCSQKMFPDHMVYSHPLNTGLLYKWQEYNHQKEKSSLSTHFIKLHQATILSKPLINLSLTNLTLKIITESIVIFREIH